MKIDELVSDLLVDKVISAGRARRHYGVNLAAAKRASLLLLKRHIPYSRTSRKAKQVTFLAVDRFYWQTSGNQLRHLAGVTALRLDNDVPVDSWLNEGGLPFSTGIPDGIWLRPEAPNGAWALEYDAGSYTTDMIIEKAKTYANTYPKQIWGVAVPARVKRIAYALAIENIPARVEYSPWWE